MSISPTLQGLVAIVLWASLASLTALAGPVPPFQLAAMTFGAGTLACLAWAMVKGRPIREIFKLPLGAFALGVCGLLGYHVLYFYALKTAPTMEANVVNYVWPLLIVLFSALLPVRAGGTRLRWWHVAGAALGFIGTVVAMAGSVAAPSLSGAGSGHLAALLAAIVWAGYSVLSRLFQAVPSSGVVASCAATALGAMAIHLCVETTHWPATSTQWLTIAAMGVGPVGIAFYLWDTAVKHGDLRQLGVASYATPLMSTALLAALGIGQAGAALWMAAGFVTAGALLAAWDTLRLSPLGRLR